MKFPLIFFLIYEFPSSWHKYFQPCGQAVDAESTSLIHESVTAPSNECGIWRREGNAVQEIIFIYELLPPWGKSCFCFLRPSWLWWKPAHSPAVPACLHGYSTEQIPHFGWGHRKRWIALCLLLLTVLWDCQVLTQQQLSFFNTKIIETGFKHESFSQSIIPALLFWKVRRGNPGIGIKVQRAEVCPSFPGWSWSSNTPKKSVFSSETRTTQQNRIS